MLEYYNSMMQHLLCILLPQWSMSLFPSLHLQIAFYEQVKQMLISTGYFRDNIVTHLSASIVAVSFNLNYVNSLASQP